MENKSFKWQRWRSGIWLFKIKNKIRTCHGLLVRCVTFKPNLLAGSFYFQNFFIGVVGYLRNAVSLDFYSVFAHKETKNMDINLLHIYVSMFQSNYTALHLTTQLIET